MPIEPQTPPTVDALTATPPARDGSQTPSEFGNNTDQFLSEMPSLQTQINTATTYIGDTAQEVYDNAIEAADAAEIAGAAANYQGEWSTLTGAYNKGISVSESGIRYLLKVNVADITAVQPSSSPNEWLRILNANVQAVGGHAVFSDTTKFATGETLDGAITLDTVYFLRDNGIKFKTQGFYAGSTRGNAEYLALDSADMIAGGYAVGYSAFEFGSSGVFACLVVGDGSLCVELLGSTQNDHENDIMTIISHAAKISKNIIIPVGTYYALSELNLTSDLMISGSVNTIIKYQGNIDLFSFLKISTYQKNISIKNIEFDASFNYPVSTIYKFDLDDSVLNYGILVTSKVDGLIISNCVFRGFSFGSIRIRGKESTGIIIEDCDFYKGAYLWKCIAIHSDDAVSELEYHKKPSIKNCNFYENGPQSHLDASKSDYISSSDAVHLDRCLDINVENIYIEKPSAIGLRIEECIGGVVSNITTRETGQEGVTCYLNCSDIVVSNLDIKNFGRTIQAYALREYAGNYYIAQETPDQSSAPLPADPSISNWFILNPYDLSGVDELTILSYSSSDYINTNPSTGIIPFRGYAGYSVTNYSSRITSSNARISGSTEVISGKRVYASDYGTTPIHAVNAPTESGHGNTFDNFNISDVWTYDVWHPRYMDSINYTTQLGESCYGNINADVYNLFSNKGNNNSQGVFTATLTTTTGSISLGNDLLSYSRFGNRVFVTGKVRVTSVSTPSGDLSLSGLPLQIGFGSEESEVFIGSARIINATEVIDNGLVLYGELNLGTSISILKQNNGASEAVADKIQAGTQITFSFNYLTGYV